MFKILAVIVAAMLALTSAAPAPHTAAVSYYMDEKCETLGGGPPGLLANPYYSEKFGVCSELLTSGLGVVITHCDRDHVYSEVYPNGCHHERGENFTVPLRQCTSVNGMHVFARCFW